VECRADDREIHGLIAPLHHGETAACVLAERAINRRLFGGCQVPIAGHARLRGERIELEALVGSPDGSRMVRGSTGGAADQGERLGLELAEELLRRGADSILAALSEHGPGAKRDL
jgi:hydroxymethylbilane synthase